MVDGGHSSSSSREVECTAVWTMQVCEPRNEEDTLVFEGGQRAMLDCLEKEDGEVMGVECPSGPELGSHPLGLTDIEEDAVALVTSAGISDQSGTSAGIGGGRSEGILHRENLSSNTHIALYRYLIESDPTNPL